MSVQHSPYEPAGVWPDPPAAQASPVVPAVQREPSKPLDVELTLRAITDATAACTGASFFRALVKHLAEALVVRYSFVGECLPNRRARSRGFWKGDGFGDDFEYDLHGTPCLGVSQGRTVHCAERLPDVFPEDAAMIAMGTQSYLGVPLVGSSGHVIGHLVIFDTKPMQADPGVFAVLETFAGRLAAELERAQAYEQLAALGQELKMLLDVNIAVGRHLQRDELFGALASCLRNLLETDTFGIELPIEGGKLQGHLLTPHSGSVGPTQPTVLPAEGTACNWVMQQRRWLVTASREELRERFPVTFEVMSRDGMESLCALPLAADERCLGALFFMAARRGAYDGLRQGLLEQMASSVAVALDNCLAHEEVRRLRDRLQVENVYLQEEIRTEHNFQEIVGNSPSLLGVLRAVEQVAATDSTVLITGETGTGKELIARAIHDRSRRRQRALVKVNCAAIPPALVESELFGHVKGAFTGAIERRVGRFQTADGGSIFLDEIGDLSPDIQVKLLRVLQERELEPVGTNKTVRVDVRVVAATNRDLKQLVQDGRFRVDLFYRLNVFPIHVPPLRERRADIPLLVTFFLQKLGRALGKPGAHVSEETMRRLVAYSWPGNVRELQNVIERAVILASGPLVALDGELQPAPAAAAEPRGGNKPPVDDVASLEDVERRHIEAVLSQTGGVIEGERGAAKILDLNPNTLRSRMKKLGIRRPGRGAEVRHPAS